MQNNRLKLVEITGDGSPTLRMDGSSQDPLYTEQMHYSTGAASETIYIYGKAIKRAQAAIKSEDLSCLVVGLGLGYIEILVSILTDGQFKKILSFEKDEGLIRDFRNWCNQPDLKLYNQVTDCLLARLEMNISLDLIKESLKERHKISPALETPHNQHGTKFNVICYDAFSSRMDQKLWDFDFLNQFIQAYCADQCVFASYAKTGALNRALKQNGFKLLVRKGFSTKRESTLAVKI
jgi:tRNA U34 5-methylaminomethyl-2-thiouridine-forming methyltransferase MnmC